MKKGLKHTLKLAGGFATAFVGLLMFATYASQKQGPNAHASAAPTPSPQPTK